MNINFFLNNAVYFVRKLQEVLYGRSSLEKWLIIGLGITIFACIVLAAWSFQKSKLNNNQIKWLDTSMNWSLFCLRVKSVILCFKDIFNVNNCQTEECIIAG